MTVITTRAMKTTTVEAKAAVMRRMKMITLILAGDRDESSDVILAFIDDEEKNERPATWQHVRKDP